MSTAAIGALCCAAARTAAATATATRASNTLGTMTLGLSLSSPTESAIAEVKNYVRFGSGPRGSQALVLAAKAHAAVRGEAAADVEDVVALALPALRHRLVLSYRAEVDGVKDADVVAALVRQVRA